MNRAAAAIFWEFRQRHRWGFAILAAYFAILAIVSPGRVVFVDAESFAWATVTPLTMTVIYFFAIFSYGISGDLAARQSAYPSRMFSLPLTTNELAGWPMLFGTVAIAVLWLLTRFLGVWPANRVVPVIWPAVMGASMLAWTQALTWMPYPLRGLRVIITVFWLALLDAIVMVALEVNAGEPAMLAVLAPQVPIAFLVARFAISRARHQRGGGRRSSTVLGQPGRLSSTRNLGQLWFEWREHGRTLPFLVALVLPFELALLFVFRETPVIIFEMLMLAMITTPFMAGFVAAASGDRTPAFTATRPLSDASLTAAKFKAALVSTAVAWALVIVAVPIALKWSGTSGEVAGWWRTAVEVMSLPRAIALLSVLILAFMTATWKRLVHNLFIGLSGRDWLIKGSVFASLIFLAVIGPLLHWLGQHREARSLLWNGFPSIAGVLVAAKVAIARPRLHGAVAWTVSVFSLYAVLAWIFPDLVIRHYVLMLIAILAIPLARVSAAPLMLAWSRHR